MGCTLSKCVVNNKNFLKCTLGVDIHLKDALLQLYHDPNAVTNPLPTNGVDLFNFFNDPKRRNRLESLLKNKKIFQDQYDLLLPQHGVVDSSLWDITLITFVGIQFLNLSATLKKIMESSRKTRNDLKHGNAEDYKHQQKFDDTMDDIEQLLIQLNYNKIADFNQLRNDNIQIDFNLLCKHHNALMQNLQTRLLQEHDTTKKDLFKEILENLQNNKRKKKLHSQGTRLVRSFFKNILISLHKLTLSIDKVLTISYGKDEGEDIEIEYETLQAVDYTITVDNDEILIHITKELLSDFEYHFLITTLKTDGTEEDNQFQFQVRVANPAYIGTFENLQYVKGAGKNDWHYVTITYNAASKSYTWSNRAGISWSLYPTSKSGELRVGQDCPPYYSTGHTIANFTADGVYGPSNELYSRKVGNPLLCGDFENHEYDLKDKNDWHYVHIDYDESTQKYTWSNRAGVKWSMYQTNVFNKLRVGEDCLYFENGYTEAIFNENGIYGPHKEFYDKK